MTVREIIKEYLKNNGYGGLCCEDCGCEIDNLMPCDYNRVGNCMLGYKHDDVEIEDELHWIVSTHKDREEAIKSFNGENY